jgi:hypothetical protein
MLCYRLNNLVLFHLNAQKGYVSLYCGDSKKIDPDGILLTGLNIGKGLSASDSVKAKMFLRPQLKIL